MKILRKLQQRKYQKKTEKKVKKELKQLKHAPKSILKHWEKIKTDRAIKTLLIVCRVHVSAKMQMFCVLRFRLLDCGE